jgi:hypothetical protein
VLPKTNYCVTENVLTILAQYKILQDRAAQICAKRSAAKNSETQNGEPGGSPFCSFFALSSAEPARYCWL